MGRTKLIALLAFAVGVGFFLSCFIYQNRISIYPNSPPLNSPSSYLVQRTYTPVAKESSSAAGVIHVVMVFPLILSEVWKGLGYNGSSVELKERRQREYVECLQTNLNISTVAKIHLLTNEPVLLRKKLQTEYKLDTTKIIVYGTSLNPTYREMFTYASDFLQNKLVFILNADNFMGKGFEAVSLDWWKKSGNVMYALTRQRLKTRPSECQKSATGYCDKDGSYIGSHDGFMFYMKAPLPKSFLSELEFPSHTYGSENVVIWAFQRKINFSVKNPCRRLVIYHNHCSELRSGKRKRVNINGKSGTAPFSE